MSQTNVGEKVNNNKCGFNDVNTELGKMDYRGMEF